MIEAAEEQPDGSLLVLMHERGEAIYMPTKTGPVLLGFSTRPKIQHITDPSQIRDILKELQRD
jgi:hypothetical protein